MRFTQPAGPDELFAVGAFARSIGRSFMLTGTASGISEGTLISAEVVDDGRAVLLEVEIPDDEMPDRGR